MQKRKHTRYLILQSIQYIQPKGIKGSTDFVERLRKKKEEYKHNIDVVFKS